MNSEFWWDPMAGAISYAVTIVPTLGGATVFTGSTPNNYINTTSLPLTAGVKYDVNITPTCLSGLGTMTTKSFFMNPDGTYISTSDYFFFDINNFMSWGTITALGTDYGTLVTTSIAPTQTGILIDPGIIITSGSGPAPKIMPMWYTTNFLVTIHNTDSVSHIANGHILRNGVTEVYSGRVAIAAGATGIVPISLFSVPHNTDSFFAIFSP